MWSKLDDGFPDHPKVVEAGPLASWLYVCGLCYSNRYLTDGFIPVGQVRKLADVDGALALAERLVQAGLWEQVDGGYAIHDFHDLNMTAEEAKARREEISTARAEAGKRGADARWQNGKPDGKLPYKTHGKTDGKRHGKTMAPNQNQNQNLKPVPDPAPKGGDTPIPADFEVTDDMFNKVRYKHPNLDIDGATETWQNSMRANTKKYRYTNWRAAWYGAMDRAAKWQQENKGNGGYTDENGNLLNKRSQAVLRQRDALGGPRPAPETPRDRPRLVAGADPI